MTIPHLIQTHEAFFPAILAGAGLINLASGFIQKNKAQNELDKMVKPEGYDITPEQQASYDRAQQLSAAGFTQDEKAAYLSKLASANNQSYNKAFQYGGNTLAGAIRSGVNYSNLGALNNFAAQDAQLHRSNIRYADQRGDVISGQRNRETGNQIQDYNMKQQAYGQAVRAGKENMLGSLNMFAALYPGIGGGAKSPLTQPQIGYGATNNTMQPFNFDPLGEVPARNTLPYSSGVDWNNPYKIH